MLQIGTKSCSNLTYHFAFPALNVLLSVFPVSSVWVMHYIRLWMDEKRKTLMREVCQPLRLVQVVP